MNDRADANESRNVRRNVENDMSDRASESAPTPSVDNRYERFQAALIPLMSTVMAAKLQGHPDLDRHMQNLSDLINRGID